MIFKNWNIEEITGYKPLTTFYTDFSIADHFGKNAIIETYNRAFKEWKNDYKYLTELGMVLNWKIWEHYENGMEEFAEVYDKLYEEVSDYAYNTLKGEELSYYIRTTD